LVWGAYEKADALTAIQQPIEGSHPPKEDVPATPATAANAGEGKGKPDGEIERSETEDALAAEQVRAETISSG
jgi:hypothetical protein